MELSHFLFRFFRNHKSHHIGLVEDFDELNHAHRPLINPMRDNSGKTMKQRAILDIIF
jgi:hypothetical protein